MSAITEDAWCEVCATVTAHELLTNARLECLPCGAVRGRSGGLYQTEEAS